jgi:hypothetical protein
MSATGHRRREMTRRLLGEPAELCPLRAPRPLSVFAYDEFAVPVRKAWRGRRTNAVANLLKSRVVRDGTGLMDNPVASLCPARHQRR